MSSIDISRPASPEISIGNLDDANSAELQALAFDMWREAEAQVRAQWRAFLMADRPSRRRAAFADYLTALDAEAAAADVLADAHLHPAAAA